MRPEINSAVVVDFIACDTNKHRIFTLCRTSIKDDWRVNWEKSVARALQGLEDGHKNSVPTQSSLPLRKEPKISKTENVTIKGNKDSCVRHLINLKLD